MDGQMSSASSSAHTLSPASLRLLPHAYGLARFLPRPPTPWISAPHMETVTQSAPATRCMEPAAPPERGHLPKSARFSSWSLHLGWFDSFHWCPSGGKSSISPPAVE